MNAFKVAQVNVKQQLAEERLLLEYIQELQQQVRLGQALSRLSPTSAFMYAADEASGGGLLRFQRFLDNAVRYREQVFEAILAADRDDEDSQHRYQPWSCGSNAFSQRKVDLGPAAEFRDSPPSSSEGLVMAGLDVILLVTYNVVLFLLAFVRFMRQDVTVGAAA